MKKQIVNSISFIFFMLVCTGIFNLLTPYFYRMMPNDYIRTKLILNILADSTQTPDVVVFGNSRGMSGVDGYKLEKELKGNPVVYSFTSTGQRLNESALYYTSLPSSVKTVIQCVDIDQLSKPVDLDMANQVALHMYGYKGNEVLAHSRFYYNYEARNCLFTGLTTYLRNRLDDDVIPEAVEYDLHYPNSSTSECNEATYQRDVEEQNKTNKFANYQILSEWKELINNYHTYFKEKNITYYLVVMPYNPDITSVTPLEKQQAYDLFGTTFKSLSVIDCMNLLEPADFYDAIHPNRRGAEKITNRIVTSL